MAIEEQLADLEARIQQCMVVVAGAEQAAMGAAERAEMAAARAELAASTGAQVAVEAAIVAESAALQAEESMEEAKVEADVAVDAAVDVLTEHMEDEGIEENATTEDSQLRGSHSERKAESETGELDGPDPGQEAVREEPVILRVEEPKHEHKHRKREHGPRSLKFGR